ncbi:MAG: ABC transporter ATP-binding protein [Clostridia bacterium]|nr:ABC transporter ATP-binding protein [Clostridia bacterium]
MAQMPLIEISHLTKTYVIGDNEVNALDDVSLSIEEHEFTAIVGPSGSGKSTLMNIIGCLDVATSGSYKLNGQEISSYNDNELSEVRNKTIGFIFQKFNLLSKLTAIENVELPLVYQGVGGKQRREKAIASLKSMGLESRMRHKPTELSGGQQQRVAIARALITDPPVILADEPTGNLDSRTGAEVLGILRELNEKGNTIVLITHDMRIAAKAKRVIHLMDGRIESDEEVGKNEIHTGN